MKTPKSSAASSPASAASTDLVERARHAVLRWFNAERDYVAGCLARVRAGDILFLPRRQLHSLQCTDPGGMLLVGVIYPGDNPSISY